MKETARTYQSSSFFSTRLAVISKNSRKFFRDLILSVIVILFGLIIQFDPIMGNLSKSNSSTIFISATAFLLFVRNNVRMKMIIHSKRESGGDIYANLLIIYIISASVLAAIAISNYFEIFFS